MNRYIMLIFLILFSSTILCATENEITVITDRNIFASGEIVLVKVYFTNGESSKVVYLDLLYKKGKHIVGSKLKVENQQASGFITIPDSLSSGTCFLKVFTNHKRDNSYALKELLVLNRFEPNNQRLVVDAIHLKGDNKKNLDISWGNLDKSYSKRQSIQLNLSISDHQFGELAGDLIISVANHPDSFKTGHSSVNMQDSKLNSLVENNGLVLMGKVTTKSTEENVFGATVMISMPDSIPFFDYCETDENGCFYFLMDDFYGSSPLVIQASKNGKKSDLKIEIFEKFNDSSINYKINREVLSASLNEFAHKTIQIENLKRVFGTKDYILQKKSWHSGYAYPFYGEPIYQVDPDEFFDLKNFEEISREILPTVRYRERDGKYSLHLLNQPVEDFFKETPFMLLDGVPVDSIPLIAKMGTKHIDWVDIVPRERFYGDLTFPGVLAIYTKENDASLIASSDHQLKFDYEGLQNKIELLENYPHKTNTPDLRQVLFWEANLKAEKEIQIKLKTSDVKGVFRIHIAGQTKSGEILESIQTFKVN